MFGNLDIFKESNMMKSDVYEEGNNYVVLIELPGFNKENIDISYQNDYITVTAKKVDEYSDVSYIHKEITKGIYSRSFYAGNINDDEITASYLNGILKISFPKEGTKDNKKQIKID